MKEGGGGGGARGVQKEKRKSRKRHETRKMKRDAGLERIKNLPHTNQSPDQSLPNVAFQSELELKKMLLHSWQMVNLMISPL